MPQLKELYLDYSRNTFNKSVIVIFQHYSIGMIWQTVNKDDGSKLVSIFSMLKSLKAFARSDPILDQEVFPQFINRRAELGHPQVESVDIHLANNCSDYTSGLEDLAQVMLGFSYKKIEQWKTKHSEAWSLTTKLHSQFWIDFNWNDMNACRRNLRSLKILCSVTFFKKFQKELLNMPELKKFEITFEAPNEQGSFSALWSAVLRESKDKDEEKALKLILPKLKKLRIINDASLSPEVIVIFMDMRSRLGLTQIRSLKVCLASKISESDMTEVMRLKEKVVDFTMSVWMEMPARQKCDIFLKIGRTIMIPQPPPSLLCILLYS